MGHDDLWSVGRLNFFLAHGCSEPTFCCFLFVFHPKVRRFYLRQQKRREVLEWRDQERLAALRSIMDKQARRDRERWVSDYWTAKLANGLYLFIFYLLFASLSHI